MSVLGNSAGNSANLIRTQIYSDYVQEALTPVILNDSFLFDVTDFGDGTTLNIPTIGEAVVRDRVEGQQAQFSEVQDGVFNLTINQFKETANALTTNLLEDGYKGEFLMGRLAKMHVDALMQAYISDVLATQDAQTASDANQVNGTDHRYVAEAADDKVSLPDFAYAGYSLSMANIPESGRVAIVHPTVLHDIGSETNITNLLNNPGFQGVVQTGMQQDEMMSIFDIYGFKVMSTHLVPSGITETITHKSNSDTITNGVANLFMSIAGDDTKPLARAWRRQPLAESEYDMKTQQHLFMTTARWGCGLLLPQGLVTVLGLTT